jgi:hypothetical protein
MHANDGGIYRPDDLSVQSCYRKDGSSFWFIVIVSEVLFMLSLLSHPVPLATTVEAMDALHLDGRTITGMPE